ncbi:MAG: 4-hydroxy-tetrahydrodipicolinate synthase, partial [Gemmatimonadota bacterium]
MNDSRMFAGLGVALVTPFREDGAFDRDAFEAHVKFQVAGGVDALVPCGTTGESATMDATEQREVIAAAVAVAAGVAPSETPSGRRVVVIAGAGSNSTRAAAQLAAGAREAGADAVLSVGPYYNKPTQEGFYRHFRAVAEAAEIPVILYNVPGRTGSNILPETVLRLARTANIVGVKEASGDLAQVMTIVRGRPEGFLVLSGDDELTLPVLAMGGDGVVSVASNEVPAAMSQLVHAGLAGNF